MYPAVDIALLLVGYEKMVVYLCACYVCILQWISLCFYLGILNVFLSGHFPAGGICCCNLSSSTKLIREILSNEGGEYVLAFTVNQFSYTLCTA
jgi:hypothetical protein